MRGSLRQRSPHHPLQGLGPQQPSTCGHQHSPTFQGRSAEESRGGGAVGPTCSRLHTGQAWAPPSCSLPLLRPAPRIPALQVEGNSRLSHPEPQLVPAVLGPSSHTRNQRAVRASSRTTCFCAQPPPPPPIPGPSQDRQPNVPRQPSCRGPWQPLPAWPPSTPPSSAERWLCPSAKARAPTSRIGLDGLQKGPFPHCHPLPLGNCPVSPSILQRQLLHLAAQLPSLSEPITIQMLCAHELTPPKSPMW